MKHGANSFYLLRAVKDRRRRRRLGWATLASVALHAAPLLALMRWPLPQEEPEEPLRIVALERLEIEEARPVEDARFEAEREVFVEEEQSARHAGQALRAGAERAVQASEQAVSVEASTRSRPNPTQTQREAGEGNGHRPSASRTAEGAASQRRAPSAEAGAPRVRVETASTPPGAAPSIPGQLEGEAGDTSPEPKAQGEHQELAHPSAPNWLESLARRGGVAAMEGAPVQGERVDELDYAEIARLRAREASLDLYLLEVRRRVEPHWRPRFVLRGRHADEVAQALFAGRDQALTRVAVRLDARGNIREVKVSSTSGLSQLDEHALTAFRSAAPFPPPPRHLLEGDELAFEWGARARH